LLVWRYGRIEEKWNTALAPELAPATPGE